MKATRSIKLAYKDGFWAFLLLLPNLLGFLIFTLFPVVIAFFLSFTEYDMMSSPKWVGLGNYIALFNDATFKQVLFNTLYYSLFTVPIGAMLSLFLAIALDRKSKLVRFYRAVYFLPVISSMVAVAMVWQWIYNPEFGILNYLLSLIGVKGPSWLTDTMWAMPAIIVVNIWKGLGFNMLLFLSGLQGISNTYYEAADIEGAGWWTKFTKITFPLLSPTTFFVLVMSFISSFQVFDSVFLMTGGGPGRSTSVLVHYLYQNAFQYFKMGYASALAYVLFFIVFLITLVQLIFQKKWVIY